MSLAYVDTSCLVAVAFDEPGAQELALQLEDYSMATKPVGWAGTDPPVVLAQHCTFRCPSI